MQLITLATAAAIALLPSVSADSAQFDYNGTIQDPSLGVARVHNRCSYKVYLWSIQKGLGCPADQGVVLEQGQFYEEGYRVDQSNPDIGVSLKISKTTECKGVDTTQLEYFINSNGDYKGNYLDVSYVDCLGGDCPGRKDGYYLKAGNADGQFMANDANEHCPIFSCNDETECDKTSYVNPDDRQTKFCNEAADLDFYLCGGEEPGNDSYQPAPSSAAPSSSSEEEQTPEPTSASAPSSIEAEVVAAAAITSAPVEDPKPVNVKTEVVYVTKFEYVNAKRHAHGHRHQHFRA